MSGAEPVDRLYSARRVRVLASISPSEADGNMPSEPAASAAHRQHVAKEIINDHVALFAPADKLHAAGVRRAGAAHHIANCVVNLVTDLRFRARRSS